MSGVSQCIISWILLLFVPGNIMAFNLMWIPCSGHVCECPPPTGHGPNCCIKSCGTGGCGIPEKNLTISWNNLILGPGSTTLFYNNGTWESDCVNQIKYEFGCAGNALELKAFYFIAGACPDGQSQYCSNLRSSPFQLVPVSTDCSSGITFICSDTSASCPNLAANGYTDWTVHDPDNTPNEVLTCFCIQVYGCNNLPYPGATVSVAGQTEETNAVGKACFVLPGDLSGQILTVTVSEPTGRFKTYTGTIFVHTRCGFIDPGYVQLEAADDYHCTFCYLLPLNKTLHLSVNCLYNWNLCPGGKSFDVTLTWSDHCGSWVGQCDTFGLPEFDCSIGPPVCQPYFSTLGCPGETCFPNTITASPPPAFMIEFTCNDQVNGAGIHSCANGTCSDCGIVPCTTDECAGGGGNTGYACCSSTLTE